MAWKWKWIIMNKNTFNGSRLMIPQICVQGCSEDEKTAKTRHLRPRWLKRKTLWLWFQAWSLVQRCYFPITEADHEIMTQSADFTLTRNFILSSTPNMWPITQSWEWDIQSEQAVSKKVLHMVYNSKIHIYQTNSVTLDSMIIPRIDMELKTVFLHPFFEHPL